MHGAASDHPVSTELIADVAAIEPGKTFRLGVLFTMQPEWHIYWRYAGNVGFAPTINWQLPEGFEIGPIQWPNPVRIDDEAAGLVSYAYEDEVLLFAEVMPPATLEATGLHQPSLLPAFMLLLGRGARSKARGRICQPLIPFSWR